MFRSAVTNLGLVTQNSQWFIMIGTTFVVSVFLQVSRGYNAIETGLVLTPGTAGILMSSALVGRLVQRRAQRTIIIAGFVITLAGVLLLLLLGDATSSILYFLPPLFLSRLWLRDHADSVRDPCSDRAPRTRTRARSRACHEAFQTWGRHLGQQLPGQCSSRCSSPASRTRTNDSAVLDPGQKEQIAAALEGDVSAVKVMIKSVRPLEGQPQPVVDEVVRINAEARDRALGYALLAIAALGLIGLGAALLLPPDKRPSSDPASVSG